MNKNQEEMTEAPQKLPISFLFTEFKELYEFALKPASNIKQISQKKPPFIISFKDLKT